MIALVTLLVSFRLANLARPDTVAPPSRTSLATARPGASLIGIDGFEGGQIARFWHPELHTATAGQISSAVARSGNQSMRFGWSPAQYDGTNRSTHAELATDALKNGETERWYGYSIYMPADQMADDDEPIVFCQWHGVPDPGEQHTVPPLAFYLEANNQVKVYYRASDVAITKYQQAPTSQKITHIGSAIYDRWVDYVVHVKWAATGNTGILEIWQDGKQIVDEQNVNIGYQELAKPYWKIGIYAWTGKSKYAERVLYYDEVRIGNATATYEMVKPGQTN